MRHFFLVFTWCQTIIVQMSALLKIIVVEINQMSEWTNDELNTRSPRSRSRLAICGAQTQTAATHTFLKETFSLSLSLSFFKVHDRSEGAITWYAWRHHATWPSRSLWCPTWPPPLLPPSSQHFSWTKMSFYEPICREKNMRYRQTERKRERGKVEDRSRSVPNNSECVRNNYFWATYKCSS